MHSSNVDGGCVYTESIQLGWIFLLVSYRNIKN